MQVRCSDRLLVCLILAAQAGQPLAAQSRMVRFAALPVAPPAEPVAVITQPKGEVTIRRGGEEARCPSTCFLLPGDEVRTGADGSAVLSQVYRPIERLIDNQLRLIRTWPPTSDADVVTAEIFDSLRRYYVGAWESATRPPQTLHLESPRNGLGLTGSPRFEWTGPTGARYELRLSDNAHKVLWTACTERTSLDYPAGKLDGDTACTERERKSPDFKRPLAPGTYNWEVTAVAAAHQFYDAASFTVTGP